MEQRIRLYRFHSRACTRGYRSPLYEDQKRLPDCTCPIVGEGRLRNELSGKTRKPVRILHRSLRKGNPCRDWDEARAIRELWLKWGRTTEPSSGLERRSDITIEEAVTFFFEFQEKTDTAGEKTREKYRVLLGDPINPDAANIPHYHGRLQSWCKLKGVRFIKELDDPALVNAFFMSWANLRSPLKPLELNTKRAELERLDSFLERCRKQRWIEFNHADEIKLGKAKVSQKVAWTIQEYENIMDTFEMWTDEYGRLDTPKSKMQTAFALCLRYLGQRLSDTAMLGPSNIIEDQSKFFMGLTQIKTGQYVKIPVPESLVNRLRSLPFRGELEKSFVLKRKQWTITYPTQGYWFWTGKSDLENNSNSWSMDIARVLAKCEKEHGKFKHHSTPHTFRHFFAITMLTNGVSMEQVSRWLGHSTVLITTRHYSSANADYHDASHAAYMRAVDAIEGKAKKPPKIINMRKTG